MLHIGYTLGHDISLLRHPCLCESLDDHRGLLFLALEFVVISLHLQRVNMDDHDIHEGIINRLL